MTNHMDIIGSLDRVANKNDHWLFVATLVLLCTVVYLVAKYFVKNHERLIEDHRASRESHQASLIQIVTKQAETNERLGGIIQRNTDALERCIDELNNRKTP